MSENEKLNSISPSLNAISKIPIVSVDVLPPNARYWLIDMISIQSTLGTGFFSEIGSDISNFFGTEAKMMNSKIERSIGKCKDAMRALAHQIGANAVIGADFDFSTNTKDATTVAAQGTAVFIDNIDEVFKSVTSNAFITFTGERDVSNPAYQLFLTKKYNIEKNSTLEKYLIENEVYDTLKLALAAAAKRYQAVIDEIEEKRALQEAKVKAATPLQEAKVKAATSNAGVSHEESILMNELGIAFDGEKYVYNTYRYDAVEDAINYAKKQSK